MQTKIQQQHALVWQQLHQLLSQHHLDKGDLVVAESAFYKFVERLPPFKDLLSVFIDDLHGRINDWVGIVSGPIVVVAAAADPNVLETNKTKSKQLLQHLVNYMASPVWLQKIAPYGCTKKHILPVFAQFGWQQKPPAIDQKQPAEEKDEMKHVLEQTAQNYAQALNLDERGICRDSKHQKLHFKMVTCPNCKSSFGMQADLQARRGDEGAATTFICPSCKQSSMVSSGR